MLGKDQTNYGESRLGVHTLSMKQKTSDTSSMEEVMNVLGTLEKGENVYDTKRKETHAGENIDES